MESGFSILVDKTGKVFRTNGDISVVRARFLSDCGWGTFDEVHDMFRARDERLRRSHDDDEVIRWFEHYLKGEGGDLPPWDLELVEANEDDDDDEEEEDD